MIFNRKTTEKTVHSMFFLITTVSLTVLSLIMLFLFTESIPLFETVSIKDFLFGEFWYPTDEPAEFGILSLIIGSLYVTIISSVIAIPLGLMTAIYLAEIASERMAEIVKPIVEMLASLPSIVIGFFGMVVISPLLQETFDVPIGLNLFNASLMLAFMIIPTICSLSEDAIHSVPVALKEASLALGATHLETIIKVVIPASISGICTAVILGMSRAIGETMVVLMIAGGAAMIPTSIFDPVRPMPASIAAEMAETPFGGEHYHALFATGLVLFIFTLMFNMVAAYISNKYRQVGEASL
ncbi:MAG: phosphate ABC transporter permease subunit PstC [Desulfobacterales bacterium]|nr:phosphate ABC transporter permease subunit PstC [Desulfobacterales bacterium]MCP4162176.1 phosphate ABC transporter permease subunit PstC [Deltaproteobacteria bacterium]